MKTFEQRYEAWITGQMPEPEVKAFERELDGRVPTEAELEECLRETSGLAALFQRDSTGLELPNADFLNHSVMQQIREEQEQASTPRAARETAPNSVRDWIVQMVNQLRRPVYALPASALVITAIVGASFLLPTGGDRTLTAPAALYAQVDSISFDQSRIWAGTLNESNQVLWVTGWDWIPGDTALLN